MGDQSNINKTKYFTSENIESNLDNKFWWERLIKWWSGFSLRTKNISDY